MAMIGYWHGLTLDSSIRFQTGFGSAATYVFMAWLIIWMKDRWLDAQRELEELIRSKDELVASISHELRTPMTTVVGLARELDERFADFGKGEVEEFIRLIVDESGDVANILEDLLVAASADIGTLSFDLHTVELVQEIDAALSVAPEATIDMPEGARSIEVLADAGRVRQILRNLVVNAARYGGPNRRIVLERKGEMASIAVCDDGDPIPQGERNRIFEAYRRRDAASAVPGSVGLGLTVSRELARQMGGDLIYTHDGVEGSFTLTLPLAPPRLDRSETEVEVTPLAM
jgi:signal transduction histidine kinase